MWGRLWGKVEEEEDCKHRYPPLPPQLLHPPPPSFSPASVCFVLLRTSIVFFSLLSSCITPTYLLYIFSFSSLTLFIASCLVSSLRFLLPPPFFLLSLFSSLFFLTSYLSFPFTASLPCHFTFYFPPLVSLPLASCSVLLSSSLPTFPSLHLSSLFFFFFVNLFFYFLVHLFPISPISHSSLFLYTSHCSFLCFPFHFSLSLSL